jgi:hypothetical protein
LTVDRKLKKERKEKRFNRESTENAEGTGRRGKRTGLKTGHYREEAYDKRREKSGVGSDYLCGG